MRKGWKIFRSVKKVYAVVVNMNLVHRSRPIPRNDNIQTVDSFSVPFSIIISFSQHRERDNYSMIKNSAMYNKIRANQSNVGFVQCCCYL